MPERTESESRKLLRRLRDTLATTGGGQDRLDRITHLIADSMGTEVCSISSSATRTRWNFAPPKACAPNPSTRPA